MLMSGTLSFNLKKMVDVAGTSGLALKSDSCLVRL